MIPPVIQVKSKPKGNILVPVNLNILPSIEGIKSKKKSKYKTDKAKQRKKVSKFLNEIHNLLKKNGERLDKLKEFSKIDFSDILQSEKGPTIMRAPQDGL